MRRSTQTSRWGAEPVAAKVPEITILFWIIKLLTTGLGEAAGDFLALSNLLLAAFVGTSGLLITLWLQFRTRRYIAAVYWSAVLMVAVFGTMAADGVHVLFKVPYAASTVFFALVLTCVFILWYRREGTLSIHSIRTRRREQFYWLTVLSTFALGTAAGDLTATTLGLGFLSSAVLFGVAIMVPALAWWRFRLHPVLAFWTAYVITRPLGASFADWFGKAHSFGGGLGYGDGTVTIVGFVAFVALVAYSAITKHDIQSESEDSASEGALNPPAASAPAS
ncbi:MAG: hypothetical protein M3N95_14305 [Actinomycetota bacterium]|nr:hypothetical protein [Actinomycetota bacterium]